MKFDQETKFVTSTRNCTSCSLVVPQARQSLQSSNNHPQFIISIQELISVGILEKIVKALAIAFKRSRNHYICGKRLEVPLKIFKALVNIHFA